jgi:hypothetical protein
MVDAVYNAAVLFAKCSRTESEAHDTMKRQTGMVMAVAVLAAILFALILFSGRESGRDEVVTAPAGDDGGAHSEWQVNMQTGKHGSDAGASASSNVRAVAPPEGTTTTTGD